MPGYRGAGTRGRVRRLYVASTLAAAAFTAPSLTSAQDSHYWTYQYGTRANLLGGLVIGSVVDISAVYYNPGALSLIADPELISTSKLFELSDYSADGVENRPLKLNDLRIDQAPGFFAGTMPFKFLENHVLAYSVFTRYRHKLKLDAAQAWSGDVADTVPGVEDAFAQLLVEDDLSETWVGLSWSAPLGKFGFGVSQFVAYRNQKGTRLVRGDIHSRTAAAAASSGAELLYSYWSARLLWKVGLSWEWEGIGWGLTATTPSLSLLGDGRELVNISATGQGLDGDGVVDPVFVAAYEEGLKAKYISPWSLGLGAAYGFGNSRLNFSAEYFSKNSEFVIMDGGDFEGQSTGDTVSLVLTDEQDDVLNFGLGFRHQLSAQITGYASFRTDFSSADGGNVVASLSSPLNLYFVTVGAALRIPITDITLGLGYGWGSATAAVPLANLTGANDIVGSLPENVNIRYRSLRLIFAFSI